MTSPAKTNVVPANPPAVLSAAQRHDLARQFEQAKQALRRSPPDFVVAHRVLSDCCTLDPGNTMFVQALLENLHRARGKTKTAWPWQIWQRRAALAVALREQQWGAALHHGWFLLGEVPHEVRLLTDLAKICTELEHGPSGVILLREAYRLAPHNAEVLRSLAIALGEAGQFAAAGTVWQGLRKLQPGDSLAQALSELLVAADENPAEAVAGDLVARVESHVQAGRWSAAEKLLTDESGAAGNNLRLRELGEEVMLARAREKTTLAERQNEILRTKRAAELIAEVHEEQRRIELGVAFARYERFPSEPASSWELAACLTRVGNYSEALKYLKPLQAEAGWQLRALVAAGENWQQLRQFSRALELYRAAVESPLAGPASEDWQRACYRGAILAEASGSPATAVRWFEQLVAADPEYKDVAARLDNLRAICDKGGFSAGSTDGQDGRK